MSRAKLKRAPLKEVVLELFWELSQSSQFSPPADVGYELALGSFAEKIRNHGFPVRKRIVPDQLKLFSKPEYQFWTKEATWPVVQLGRGIMTVNDTDVNYIWKPNFFTAIQKAIESLLESYEVQPHFNKIKLQYINSIDINDRSPLDFIQKEMLVEIIRKNDLPGNGENISIGQTWRQRDDSVLGISLQNGINNQTGAKAVIWTIMVELTQILDKESIFKWLDEAHNLTSNTFVNTLNKDLYASFDN